MHRPGLAVALLLALAGCPGEPAAPATGTATPAAADPEALRALKAAPPPESDLPPMDEGRWPLACGGTLILEPGGQLMLLTHLGLRPLEGEAVGLPAIAADGRRFAWSRAPKLRPETEIAALACEEGRWGQPRSLVAGPGSPDRPAISPDGAWVIWCSGASGIASLWAAPFEGGQPRQLTNAGLDQAGAAPGQPPAGFVAPPHQAAPQVAALDGGRYRATWTAPDGEHAVELP